LVTTLIFILNLPFQLNLTKNAVADVFELLKKHLLFIDPQSEEIVFLLVRPHWHIATIIISAIMGCKLY
jgi:hypothetical protein